MLERCQKTAIDRGSVYEVSEPTQVHVFGFLKEGTRMACIQAALPRFTREELKEIPCSPICRVEKDGRVVAGVVLVSMKVCFQRFAADYTRLIDLSQLEKTYEPLLDGYDSRNPRINYC
jgi:hypothetical protein